jgi:hypothetical protein
MTGRLPTKICIGATAVWLIVAALHPVQAQSQINPVAAFRVSMIDYFENFGLVPVLATRDFAVGDVIEADGINFHGRGSSCFPSLTVPAPTSQNLPGSLETNAIGVDAGFSLRRVFSADAQANLLHHVDIRFSEVTSSETDLKSLRAALDRKACPEIAPLVDGTPTELKKGEEPFFVVSAVYFGKPQATVEVADKAKLDAEVTRIGQIGEGRFTAMADSGSTVVLRSDRPMPIALRPVTIPNIIQIKRFTIRGDESVQLEWKSAACSPGAECKQVFGPFANVIKAWMPEPEKLK